MSIETTRSVSFQLIYSLEDLLGSHSLLIKADPSHKIRLRTVKLGLVLVGVGILLTIFCILLILLVLAISSNLGKVPISDWQFIRQYLLMALFATVGLYVLYLFAKHHTIGRLAIYFWHKLRKSESLKSYKFTFDDGGCVIQQESKKTEFKWQYFQFVLIGADHLVFKGRNKKLFSIPKRVFSDESQYKFFIELLKQNLSLVYFPE